jgi:hypothetical protein
MNTNQPRVIFIQRISSNEKEISHGRVWWQTRRTYFAMGPLVTVLISSIT